MAGESCMQNRSDDRPIIYWVLNSQGLCFAVVEGSNNDFIGLYSQ